MTVLNFGDQRVTILCICDIGTKAHNLATVVVRGLHRGCHVLCGLLRMCGPPAANDNQSPFRRQPVRRSAAQAITAAGYEGHFPA